MESGAGGLAASKTDLVDELLLEISSKVILSTEEDNATLRDCLWSAF